ncbi:amidohydrolase family protein [Glaciihabitans sp. INWT7]|uniref:amidohydrolase family protein n=1 Tax=Glaciihabitans sp. INWT7 TaxID=2596912 RepID=UPI00162A2010|nr:amidohydrolase family protein [Glaciihabitans sp. INWT7]QNE45525.1 amidohydrolase family protein [Glaciihabitans sp. INWT7]
METPDWTALADLPLRAWAPRSQLSAKVTAVPRARVPAIDIHNHLGRWLSDGEWMIEDVDALLAVMDGRGVETIVNLDGMWGDELEANLDRYDRAHPGRFLTFCQLDWTLLAQEDGEGLLRESLDDSAERGARGLKVWKNLGLTVRDSSGSLVLPDDERVVPVLAHAGELGLPVLIHVADPKAFFEPLDEHNERLDELIQEKDWWFGDPSRHPTFDRLLDALATLVIATPGTRYIGAHGGCAAEDLDRVESLLAAAPHFTIDIAGRLAELGRQPRRFRELIERFPDRVLFGTDIYPITSEQYELHFRFLESDDESFEYAPESPIPPQGRWTVSALDLPLQHLTAIYRDNARRVLGLS